MAAKRKVRKLTKRILAKLRGGTGKKNAIRDTAGSSDWCSGCTGEASRIVPTIYPTCPAGKTLKVNGDKDGKRDICI